MHAGITLPQRVCTVYVYVKYGFHQVQLIPWTHCYLLKKQPTQLMSDPAARHHLTNEWLPLVLLGTASKKNYRFTNRHVEAAVCCCCMHVATADSHELHPIGVERTGLLGPLGFPFGIGRCMLPGSQCSAWSASCRELHTVCSAELRKSYVGL